MNTHADVRGIEDLKARLTNPALIGAPLTEVLEEASKLGSKTAVNNIDGGRGIAVHSIGYEVQPLAARVFSAMPRARALNIEQGRPIGTPEKELAWLDWSERPPVWKGPLARWAKSEGHVDLTAGSSPVAAIIRAVSTQGVKGKRFLGQAREAMKNALPRLLSKMARQVEERAKR